MNDRSRRLPDVFYNWLSVAGAFLAATSAAVILLLILLDLFVEKTTLYLGLLTYIALPSVLVSGLILILLGAWLERRRRARGRRTAFPRQVVFDMENPRHRNVAVAASIIGALFLLGTGVGTYKAYQVTESTAFCGQLCHRVMKPEHTTYQTSPHARVACVACHIGPGADWFVKSKLSGAYQVYATLADKYPRPIPTPVKNLRPARETCLQCHWPEKFFGSRRAVYPHYLSDEKNTPYPITMLLHVGGGSSKAGGPAEGIHWHMVVANRVEYIARDEGRQDIAWVRATANDGKVTEYNRAAGPLTPEERSRAAVRTMDCMDCHNRPSHIYRSPMRAVNEALEDRRISTQLPFVKREIIKALDVEYTSSAEASERIDAHLRTFYQEDVANAEQVAAAVSVAQEIYAQNMFPEMKVTWRKYPDHLGHFQFPGCFRCHGSDLTSRDGKTISADCTACHSILKQGSEPGSDTIAPAGMSFKHPVDVGGAESDGHCASCHSGGAELY